MKKLDCTVTLCAYTYLAVPYPFYKITIFAGKQDDKLTRKIYRQLHTNTLNNNRCGKLKTYNPAKTGILLVRYLCFIVCIKFIHVLN